MPYWVKMGQSWIWDQVSNFSQYQSDLRYDDHNKNDKENNNVISKNV